GGLMLFGSDPAFSIGHLQEFHYILTQLHTGERLLQILHDALDAGLAVNPLHDLAGSPFELDEALGIEQYVSFLRGLVLETVLPLQLDDAIGRDVCFAHSGIFAPAPRRSGPIP